MAERPSGAAIGFTVFAGVMMIVMGMLHALWGLAAIIEDQFFVATRNYAYDIDVTGWGWIHLISGVIIFLAGFGVFSGAVWTRTVGVTLAVISAIANFHDPVLPDLVAGDPGPGHLRDLGVDRPGTGYHPRGS